MAYAITPFSTLTDGATVNWDCNSDVVVNAKLTSTQSFTLNMTNVLDGSQGVLKLITGTASAITITFDTDFTNKRLGTTGEESFSTYTFPASTGKEYILEYIVEGTVIHWVIGDANAYSNIKPWAVVRRDATQSLSDNTITAISWDVEVTDNANIYAAGNPTRFTIPGTGNKIATISCWLSYAQATTNKSVVRIFIYKNGSSASLLGGFAQQQRISSADEIVPTTLQGCFQIECAAGDYIEVMGYQKAGGSFNVTGVAQISIHDR